MDDAVPPSFICPITAEVMTDPVTTADGQSYEHDAIQEWLRSHNTSPVTNARLPNKKLTKNHALRNAIGEYQAQQLEQEKRQQQQQAAASSSSSPLQQIADAAPPPSIGGDAAKVILLGNSGVGKTSLVRRVKENRFQETAQTTIGLSFCEYSIPLPGGRSVPIHLWDTAGQEKYRAFTKSYSPPGAHRYLYRWAHQGDPQRPQQPEQPTAATIGC